MEYTDGYCAKCGKVLTDGNIIRTEGTLLVHITCIKCSARYSAYNFSPLYLSSRSIEHYLIGWRRRNPKDVIALIELTKGTYLPPGFIYNKEQKKAYLNAQMRGGEKK